MLKGIFDKIKNVKSNVFTSSQEKEVALDLGTANTVIYLKDEGIIIDEPTYLSRNKITEQIDKVGSDAKKIAGKEPNYITIERPLKNGIISEYDSTLGLLDIFFSKLKDQNKKTNIRIIVSSPSGVTQVEKKSFFNVAVDAGAKDIYLIEAPIAAAIGAGIDIFEPKGHLVVNVGAGTTEIAFISSGGASRTKSIRVAGDNLDDDIIEYIKEQHSIIIGKETAEELKIKSCISKDPNEKYEIRGMGIMNGLPKCMEIAGSQIEAAIQKNIYAIVDAIRVSLEEIGPEVSADIFETGVYLTGGGSNILMLKDRIEKTFNLKVTVVEDSIHAVINGMAIILNDIEKYKNIMEKEQMEY